MSTEAHITAEDITIDTDEGHYILKVEGMHGSLVIDIQDVVLDFYASVQKEIRPYVLEAESARTDVEPKTVYRSGADAPEVYGGYALDDPKHPTYHDRMSAIHDNRERGV